MKKLPSSPADLRTAAHAVEAQFERHGVRLTMGGEPTYVPLAPEGQEWQITALGPTKLRYAYALAEALREQALPRAFTIYSPGKHYPGETNPRWSINLIWRRDDTDLFTPIAGGTLAAKSVQAFLSGLLTALKFEGKWLRAVDPQAPKCQAWVLPLDHDGRRFVLTDWKRAEVELIGAEGPAGLRLPLGSVPAEVSRRALTVEIREEKLEVFLPPLLQSAWLKLLAAIGQAAKKAKCGPFTFAGYVPSDEAKIWSELAIAADPGVLEINLPPCFTWLEYATWLERLETAAESAGLRSCKQVLPDEQAGTGGGNHLLFGGPTLDENPLFTHPAWLISMLRYWQHHPALAYCFTGQYVGSASQAPRPDESASALYDLEMAYQFLEQLPAGDQRYLIGETLRHLHTDSTGNTHRSEISFDKFWNQAFPGGCRGLIEFRAVESLPRAEWMSAVALLWRAIAAMLLDPKRRPKAILDHGERLHDTYFLPSTLWEDLQSILRELKKAGFPLPEDVFREIFEWRFPQMLSFTQGRAHLSVRKALEPWPLLCETPLEGGNTSRFVDTSIERLEFDANAAFAANYRVLVQSRELPLAGKAGARVGLRYRRSAWYPSLHPGILPHMPLFVTIVGPEGEAAATFCFTGATRAFDPIEPDLPKKGRPCQKLKPELVTYDLRLGRSA